MTHSELVVLIGHRITEESVREALAQFDGFPVITPGGRFTGEIRSEPECGEGEYRADYDADDYIAWSLDGPYICTGYPGSVWDADVQRDMDNGDLGWPLVSGTWDWRTGQLELRFLGRRDDGTEEGTHFIKLDSEARDYEDFDTEDEDGNETDASEAHAILI